MDVIFYFDPSCPFCWITSRWLLLVSSKRPVKITWQPFSLALKNNELSKKDPAKAWHFGAHRVLRVMLAAEEHHVPLIDLYNSFGMEHHIIGNDFDDSMIAGILEQFKLPRELLKAADDKGYDKRLASYIKAATSVAGNDIGVPTIVFNNKGGQPSGYFGPILQSLPTLDESLKIWDSLSLLATNQDFYELKRSRSSTAPDVFSTAHC